VLFGGGLYRDTRWEEIHRIKHRKVLQTSLGKWLRDKTCRKSAGELSLAEVFDSEEG